MMIYLAISLRKKYQTQNGRAKVTGFEVESLLTIGLFINVNYWLFAYRLIEPRIVSVRSVSSYVDSSSILLVEIVNGNIYIYIYTCKTSLKIRESGKNGLVIRPGIFIYALSTTFLNIYRKLIPSEC